jgi:hypothetical protein
MRLAGLDLSFCFAVCGSRNRGYDRVGQPGERALQSCPQEVRYGSSNYCDVLHIMTRDDLQNLSRLRIKEAKVLFDHGCFAGAYYLLGYTVECALKACIAKQIRRYDFPDRKLVNDSYTHDLEKLLNISGLKVEFQREIQTNQSLAVNWAIVKDWSEQSRYSTGISEIMARDFYTAVTARGQGVFSWLRKRW